MLLGPFLLCLPVVQNLTFCPLEFRSIRTPLPTLIKNEGK